MLESPVLLPQLSHLSNSDALSVPLSPVIIWMGVGASEFDLDRFFYLLRNFLKEQIVFYFEKILVRFSSYQKTSLPLRNPIIPILLCQ